MVTAYASTPDEPGRMRPLQAAAFESSPAAASAVSWGAILAGAAAAAALTLILLMLGVGLGLSSVSPWASAGVSATTFGVTTILWLTLTQVLASAMGGYLAGRLRTKWLAVHTDEVYFRDTAHGFLAWAVSSLATAALLTSAIGSILGSGVQAVATVSAGVATAATVAGAGVAQADHGDGAMGYFVDALFRKDGAAASTGSATTSGSAAAAASPEAATAQVVAEVGRIFLSTIGSGNLSAEDTRYVGQLVAQRTGLPQDEAEKRVTQTYARLQAKLTEAQTAAKDAADKARKASAYAALWLFISLLIGAFVASFSATYGGRQRDI
jgi:hypothetical protein